MNIQRGVMRMTEQGTDRYGAEYKRTSNDFHFRLLEQDNCVCSICHATGAKIEFEYVTRNYESARQKGVRYEDVWAVKTVWKKKKVKVKVPIYEKVG